MDSLNTATDWIAALDSKNFLGVYDLLLDTANALNISVDPAQEDGTKLVDFRLLPQEIRFPELMRIDNPDARQRYYDLRVDAANFLRAKGVYSYHVDPREGKNSWMSAGQWRLMVWVYEDAFNIAVAGMKREYERRQQASKSSDIAVADGGKKIFIGHGQSPLWLKLQRFLSDTLHLDCDEFEEESPAGVPTITRLQSMLDAARFAFILMTSEDVHADGTAHARENVVHEAGLFQGRLGFGRAIILLEEDCTEFSNIHGLGQIRFPKGNINGAFEKIREVLKREGIGGAV